MPTLMPTDTRDALRPNAEKCDSRSLLLDRFVYDHPEMNEARKLHFSQVCGNSFSNIAAIRNAWVEITKDPKARREAKEKAQSFLNDTSGLAQRKSVAGATCREQVTASRSILLASLVSTTDLLFGKLQSRLMVNMAGGVMENAGLCLDRLTGIPYIPGSAVKGCARRMAIQELFDRSAGFQPASGSEDDHAKSQRLDQAAELLTQIALIFGWGDQDWTHKKKDDRFISDFAYACGAPDWANIRDRAAKFLFATFPNWKADPKKPLWESLPSFAGSVSFLPAYPVQAPNPDLELDVVTVHHKKYYAGPECPDDPASVRQWQQDWGSAPDIEEPVPVVFPTVAPGHIFAFAVVPLRNCNTALLKQARDWLKQGLATFGLGAKTNAGYGWFDCSVEIQAAVGQDVERQLVSNCED